ncbi:hypothetical protein NY2A_b545R [Paramecium bursaria Chlorella virus NY2A]|uniref:Uncharacterized protein b545R n=1 Tax=Paramecium bursaria Chlorella virus NY2A TaxID=46021 RepID=A7IX70_PBCVN|nr:hypothetical protein NY2A_b545R [Paramecium bursaria Chlorella virus NY2A]YP_001498570.1 hypothetical protein AR158_c489R [Paramecium bursaria Chlorella virus AR158]ABT14944.1 hypothetical protein NY2A_b545R [Paramecium bursaria Chlorella virus NY2A]ABU44034.1 hypothetical protein AR158_c489R [Paramecium bursaria Chlorella virus AR158]
MLYSRTETLFPIRCRQPHHTCRIYPLILQCRNIFMSKFVDTEQILTTEILSIVSNPDNNRHDRIVYIL